jgi:nitrate reductase alpha subunit
MAYDAISPIGPARLDILAANLAATIANRHRNPQRERPFKVRDFLIDWWGEARPRQMDPVEIGEVIMQYARMHEYAEAQRRGRGAKP